MEDRFYSADSVQLFLQNKWLDDIKKKTESN